MNENINILFTSVGRRTKLLQYFKKELREIGSLVAIDCSELAPALYFADNHYIVPGINEPNYIDTIMHICKKEKISAIISLIDPELSLLAKHSKKFEEIGVTTIVSDYYPCELCLDKFAMTMFCQQNSFKVPKTYKSFSVFNDALKNSELDLPVFMKPQKGSASIDIYKANNIKEVKNIYENTSNMIIQEYLDGKELGVDVYVDIISKKIISIFIKEKLKMRAGETDKAKSIIAEKLFRIIENLVNKIGLIGPIDIDIFNVNGEFYISEINPRFGGGYPLAYECGENYPKLIINNLRGIKNAPKIGDYDENIFMMKHDILTIKK
ncbi:ATP-grasp domain-containing protein [Clostridium sediminicola]|uniref:ATP-grasp domain-containing protein n=1 Tax=Clostridium sediminicola TaxID=3114879 RepID=UPI0031F20D2D